MQAAQGEPGARPSGTSAKAGNEGKVKSLQKAVQVLKCFTSTRPELRLTEISQQLGINKSTVHNILATLELENLVEQDRETGKYRLGLAILQLAHVVREGLGLRRTVLPIMERARDWFQETVHLALEQEGYVVYLESVQPADRSVARLAAGKRVHLHCTGVGKAILAFLPPERVHEIVRARGLPRFTPHTITSWADLQRELEVTRQRGYAVDNMEHEWGIRCLAVPLRGEDGRVVASMSISGPAERFPPEQLAGMAQKLLLLGIEASYRLGWQGEESR